MSVSFDLLTQDAIRYAVPLWLAGLGELVTERSGVINIGIEGMMIAGALTGWAVTVATGSPWLGLCAAAGVGLLMACLFAICTLIFDADQVVAGTALNLLALGATGLLFKMSLRLGFTDRSAQFFEPITLFSGLQAFNQYILCYLTILLAIGTHILIRRTRWGIELTALGEHPAAASAAGIRVNARRAACILFGGLTAGLAGSYLSIMFTHQFNENMTAGRGFLALAMVVFGRWQPKWLLLGGFLFGYLYAIENWLEVSQIPGLPAPQILQMAPYVLTLLVLAGTTGRTRAPAALGQPFNA